MNTQQTVRYTFDSIKSLSNIECKKVYVGEDISGEWKHDKWVVIIKSGKVSHTFDYKTGLGLRKNNVPVPPATADVIYSLLGDYDGESTFEEWCSNFGYDTDSRKAFRIYEDCVENYRKLCELFHPEDVAKLRVVLANY